MQDEWKALSQAELVAKLTEGLTERDRRIAELMGIAPTVPTGPGRPTAAQKAARDMMTARQRQLADAEGEGAEAAS